MLPRFFLPWHQDSPEKVMIWISFNRIFKLLSYHMIDPVKHLWPGWKSWSRQPNRLRPCEFAIFVTDHMNLPQPGDRFDRKASAARNKGGGDNHRRPPHGSDDRARCNRPGDAWRLLSNSWIFFDSVWQRKRLGETMLVQVPSKRLWVCKHHCF